MLSGGASTQRHTSASGQPDRFNLSGENISMIEKKNTDPLLVANQEVGLEANAERTVFMSHKQKAEQNHALQVANISI
jgi:hypothetical protein